MNNLFIFTQHSCNIFQVSLGKPTISVLLSTMENVCEPSMSIAPDSDKERQTQQQQKNYQYNKCTINITPTYLLGIDEFATTEKRKRKNIVFSLYYNYTEKQNYLFRFYAYLEIETKGSSYDYIIEFHAQRIVILVLTL